MSKATFKFTNTAQALFADRDYKYSSQDFGHSKEAQAKKEEAT